MMAQYPKLMLNTKVQVATAHLNSPTTREMQAEGTASGSRKLLQTSDAQNLRMHAEYMLDGVDPALSKILQVSALNTLLVVAHTEPASNLDCRSQALTGTLVAQNQVVPRAIRALSRALKLRAPVAGNLKLPRTCASILTDTGKCALVGEMCGGELPQAVPEDYYGEAE